MSALVSLSEFKTYLGVTDSSNDTLLQALLDDVQALFESQAGRQSVGFIPAGTGRIEVRDGTGSADLYLNYPIDALTSVKLGFDSAVPDETLSVLNKRVLVFGVGSRRLSRTDCGWFGLYGAPRFVEVTYDHQGDMPLAGKLAIQSVASSVFNRRGSEELKSETIGNFYSRTMLEDIATQDPTWQMGVDACLLTVMA